MTTTRRAAAAARIDRLVARTFHTAEAETRIQTAQHAAASAAIDPADLAALLRSDPAAAWLTLAGLTTAQLTVMAIDYTSWLNETTGRDLNWFAVLEVFEARIAGLSARKAA